MSQGEEMWKDRKTWDNSLNQLLLYIMYSVNFIHQQLNGLPLLPAAVQTKWTEGSEEADVNEMPTEECTW